MSISFSTKKAIDNKKYTKENVLLKIDDLSIFKRYIGNVKLKQSFCSPLRKDNNPSFNLFQNKDGEIMYYDHATGDSGDVFKFLKQLWNCTKNEVYKRIMDDLPSDAIDLKTKSRIKQYSDDITIGIKRKYISPIDAWYWGKYHISKETLYKFKVYPISYYTLSYDNITHIKQAEYTSEDPIYAYKVNDRFKIYRPLTKFKINKWRGNLRKQNVFGYEQLPKQGDLLIITKSLKDVMVLYELGYTAIAPSSESTEIPKDIIAELKTRFKRIVLFFDNDEAGIKHSLKYSDKYKFERIQINPSEGIKDISDFIDIRNYECTINYIEFLLDGNS